LRALDVLGGADLILAEDTRQTRKLLDAYDIKASLMSYHDHNVAQKIPQALSQLEAGKTLALVSDAGTPLISDPGYKLVGASINAGYQVFPIPGASALLAGLTVSGLPTDQFLFAGFLPAKTGARRKALENLVHTPATLVFFESGARLAESLADMMAALGNRRGVIARELTKKFEETRRGTMSDLIDGITASPPKGEIVVMIAPPAEQSRWPDTDIDKALIEAIPEMGVKRASVQIAELSGWPQRDIYKRALNLK
jgi:16S rRNA (cytidine1402-2'-O)-methyltransferase